MKTTVIKVKSKSGNYSIIIGENILNILPKKIKESCPKTKKIGLVIDKNVPKKFKFLIKKYLKSYEIFFFEYKVNESLKTFSNVNALVESCIKKKFNRNDILIALGGGIVGDFCAFSASILKRGINFINIPTTLLAQADSSIGGKTGVNSTSGKNLIGTFYQPRFVLSDVSILQSLPKREMICGYAEILKHSLILKNNLFKWIQLNSKNLIENKNLDLIHSAIKQSCKVKLFYVNKDVNESNTRMILNFGHTFAHGIEAQKKFFSKINHGEAVLMGMMIATKLSYKKKICSKKTLDKLIKVYKDNNLNYSVGKFFKPNEYNNIINFMSNDKKNNDKKINLILLKKIGKTTQPGKYKISLESLKKVFKKII